MGNWSLALCTARIERFRHVLLGSTIPNTTRQREGSSGTLFAAADGWAPLRKPHTYMLGVLMGSLVLGRLSDKFGRKTIFIAAGVLQ